MHALEKEMATHSSILAWRIPGTEDPGGLSSMGSHKSRTRLKRLSSSSSLCLLCLRELLDGISTTYQTMEPLFSVKNLKVVLCRWADFEEGCRLLGLSGWKQLILPPAVGHQLPSRKGRVSSVPRSIWSGWLKVAEVWPHCFIPPCPLIDHASDPYPQ